MNESKFKVQRYHTGKFTYGESGLLSFVSANGFLRLENVASFLKLAGVDYPSIKDKKLKITVSVEEV